MKKDTKKYIRLREEMVLTQIENRGIHDPAVLDSMRKIPRHFFVFEALMDQAYGDFPLPIGEQQTISQPHIVAEMTQILELTKDHRVLELGTGSGYQTAILANIVYRVYTIERIHSLFVSARKLFDQLKYHNIITKYTDGTVGWKEESPFDAIIVTAGSPRIPEDLLDQLALGGKMIIPVGDSNSQELLLLHKTNSGIKETILGRCRFVKLIGKNGWEE